MRDWPAADQIDTRIGRNPFTVDDPGSVLPPGHDTGTLRVTSSIKEPNWSVSAGRHEQRIICTVTGIVQSIH